MKTNLNLIVELVKENEILLKEYLWNLEFEVFYTENHSIKPIQNIKDLYGDIMAERPSFEENEEGISEE